MSSTPKPDLVARLDSPERLKALKASGLYRHDLQGRLDLLCASAAELLKVPLCQVNVLDEEIQTSIGKWPPDGERIKNVKVEGSGCQYVILASDVVMIPNTLLHPVMCMEPVVTVAGIISYLGVPIWHDDEVMGAFCVADYVVRDWNHWDVAGLQGLARLAGLAVDREH